MVVATTTALDVLRAQCDDLVALVGELDPAEWERPTRCPPMRVVELIAHLIAVSRSTASLARTDASGQEPNTDGTRWWTMPDRRPPEEILAVAQETAVGLDPQRALEALTSGIGDMVDALSAVPPDAIVGSADRLRILTASELAVSRVLEFGVHTMDIGHATLRGERVVAEAVAIIKRVLATLLGADLPVGMGWDDRTFILSGTGRRQLEPNERFALGPLASKFPLLR